MCHQRRRPSAARPPRSKLHTGRRWVLAASALALVVSAIAVQTQTVGQPSIATGQIYYSDGDEVVITGQNWPAGELVTLQIVEDGNPGHVDTLYAEADTAGGLAAEYVVPGHGTVQNFTLSATSPSVGTAVTTLFTDAGTPGTRSRDATGWTTPSPTTSPWVRTDQSDYQPGEIAHPRRRMERRGACHARVRRDGTANVPPARASARGGRQYRGIRAGFVLQSHDLGGSYRLTATSSTDPSMTAWTAFTDDTVAQPLPFAQDWTNAGLIAVNDNWSGVPGVVGFLGQDITTATGTDPQRLLTDAAAANDLDVIANQTNPNTLATGGVAEFGTITNPTVALQGSATADAPYLLLYLNTTGQANIRVTYSLRDIDGSTDNAVQPVALHYRVGPSGLWTNVPDAFVADATEPSLATLVTPVSVQLPAAVNNQALVQLRIMTTNAVGSDEWVGVDDISVAVSLVDPAPAVQATTSGGGAVNVGVDANISVTFSEPVTFAAGGATIACANSGTHPAVVTGGPSVFTLNPDTDFAASELCTVTILGAWVSDVDTLDPPDTMAGDYIFSFTTGAAPPAAGSVVIGDIYGGGGNSGATFTHDFIEIYNRTSASISLAGWSVQYASAAGNA